MSERVFVLDHDLVSPLGIGKTDVFNNIEANYIATKKIKRFSTEGLPIDFAADIDKPLQELYKNEHPAVIAAASYDRKFELTVALYSMMKNRLEALSEMIAPARSGVVFGLGADSPPIEQLEGMLEKDFIFSEDSFLDFFNKVNRTEGHLNRFLNPYDISALYLAKKMNLGAFQKTVLTACTASTQAIALGYDSVKSGETDITIAGGTDSIINILAFISFNKLGVLSTNMNDPQKACKPFDITRNGTLAGEAAGLCVLASEKFIVKNKLTPKFELLGYGNTLDAYNITAPDPKGGGMKRAFAQALKNAELKPEQVDYINLHGTGTRSNDTVEIDSVIEVFGECAKEIPMSSTKDRHGHAIAAAGIQEFSILCSCMENELVPCNVNLEKPVGNGGADLVMNRNRKKKINIALTTNFAFGGVNTVLALKKI